jgi:Na+/H+ antiporter NhaA
MQSIPFPRTILRTIAERRPLIMSIVVLGWSIKYTVSLGLDHTTGPEVYGVLTAALSTGAALATLALLRSSRMSTIVVGAVLVLWAVVALGGVAGTIAHVVGPVAGHGPVDLRPRPIPAPLIFTVLGVVGSTALVLGRRAAGRRARNHEEV